MADWLIYPGRPTAIPDFQALLKSTRMRNRLISASLKQHFRNALAYLPEQTRGDLRSFIRQVREVKQLEGTTIGCPDGTRFGPLKAGAGFTFLYKDDAIAFCDVLLESSLGEGPPAQAIYIILHELVHASDYQASPEQMIKTPTVVAESAVYTQVMVWAEAGIPDERLRRQIAYWAVNHLKQSLQSALGEDESPGDNEKGR